MVLRFNGTSTIVDFTNNLIPDGNSDFRILMRVRVVNGSTAAHQVLCWLTTNDTCANRGTWMASSTFGTANGHTRLWIMPDQTFVGSDIRDGVLHTIELERDGNTFRQILDGSVDATGTRSIDLNCTGFRFGADMLSNARFMNGDLFEVIVYDSNDDIVHHYKCDEGTGTVLTDSVGDEDGTITGGSWVGIYITNSTSNTATIEIDEGEDTVISIETNRNCGITWYNGETEIKTDGDTDNSTLSDYGSGLAVGEYIIKAVCVDDDDEEFYAEREWTLEILEGEPDPESAEPVYDGYLQYAKNVEDGLYPPGTVVDTTYFYLEDQTFTMGGYWVGYYIYVYYNDSWHVQQIGGNNGPDRVAGLNGSGQFMDDTQPDQSEYAHGAKCYVHISSGETFPDPEPVSPPPYTPPHHGNVVKTLEVPKYKLRLFTSEYNSSTSVGNDLYQETPWYIPGWLTLDEGMMPVYMYTVDDNIRTKSTMLFRVNGDFLWMFKCDIIARFDAAVYYHKSADNQPIPDGTRLFVTVHDAGDVTGTVVINGETLENGEDDSETITINGEGTYLSTKHFKTIDEDGIDCTGLTAVVSVWGDIGLSEQRREIQLWVDGNGDGNYGLIFAGNIVDIKPTPRFNNTVLDIRAEDYTEELMSVEFRADNHAPWRCANFQPVGANGVCLAENPNFGMRCLSGDFGPYHPNDEPVASALHRCDDYTPNYDVPFHWDGYTYDEWYAPHDEPGYAYFPADYTRALLSLSRVMNHLEGNSRSTRWTPAVRAIFRNQSIMQADTTMITLINYTGWGMNAKGGDHTHGDFIKIGGEFMEVIATNQNPNLYYDNATTTIVVDRGRLGFGNFVIAAGTDGELYQIATRGYGITSDTYPILIETDVSTNVYATGERYAETMSEHFGVRECVFWVDYYRQLHFTNMYDDDPSFGGYLEFGKHDVLAVSELGYSDVFNRATGMINTQVAQNVLCEMLASEIPGIANSVKRFGYKSTEIDTKHLNGIGENDLGNPDPHDDVRGFRTAATNYLMSHAYPVVRQTITVHGLYPSEWHWTYPNVFMTMNYTSPKFNYIDLKGRTCMCDDYNFEDRRPAVWTIERIRYSAEQYGDAVVRITMTRKTTESDYIV